MTAYYNEFDPEKVAALHALMRDGWIAPGEIDSRDIRDVTPAELSGFTQCHFFAGIGLWSVAARRAGIPDDFPFWSGSCPCQPFSTAGAGEGIADDRHVWPFWYWLVAQCRPGAVVGEQVASKDGLAWVDLVSADMEGSHYAGGSIDLCSAGFGAPNIRQRIYMCWLADDDGDGRKQTGQCRAASGYDGPFGNGPAGGVVDSTGAGLERHAGDGDRGDEPGRVGAPAARPVAEAGAAGGVADARCISVQQYEFAGRDAGAAEPTEREARELEWSRLGDSASGPDCGPRSAGRPVRDPVPGLTNGFWSGADFLLCRDPDGPRLRPVESGSFCLAAGYPGRNGALRGYGDAINLEVATEFLMAVKPDLMGERLAG